MKGGELITTNYAQQTTNLRESEIATERKRGQH